MSAGHALSPTGAGLDHGSYPEPPPGWSATTPFGAPWPYDPAVLDQADLGPSAPLLVSRLEPLAELPAGLAGPHADRNGRARLVVRARSGDRATQAWPSGAAIRRLMWGGIAVAVILAVGSVLFGLAGNGGPARSASSAHSVASTSGLSLPRHIGSYVRAQQGSDETLEPAGGFASAAHTAVYQRNGKPGLAAGAIGIHVGYVRASSASSMVRRFYRDFEIRIGRLAEGQAYVGKPRAYPAGSLGGQVRCWRVTAPSAASPSGSEGAACLWADNDTFGFLLAPGLPASSLATTLLIFRSAIEMHPH